jgi:hypothetical protein
VDRVSGAQSIKVAYFNEQITIDAWVMPKLPYDIIIGRPTPTKHRLLLDNKISLSGERFNFKYIRDEACQCCTRPKPSSVAHASRLKLSLDEQIPTPILRDPAIIAADPHEQAQKRRLFNNKAARKIVNDINKLAKKRVRETVSLLQTEMSEGRLRAASQHAEAEYASRDDTVTASLHYLYLLQGVDAEFANQQYSRDSKHTIAQYLFLTHGERLHKDALLDPIDDDNEIDYTHTEPPWEQKHPGRETVSIPAELGSNRRTSGPKYA